jgi:hypothetical protein
MPHFGLMHEDDQESEEGLLMRAKLHVRGGKRRLRQNKIKDGVVTLYDALISAMNWYVASPERRMNLRINENDNLDDDKTLYDILARSGVLDGIFDYEAFMKLVSNALNDSAHNFDHEDTLSNLESVLRQLGVMPFDESKLPPEDPLTF